MGGRLLLALAAVVAVAGLSAPKASAQPAPDRVRFEAPAGETLLVHGTYPEVQSSCVSQPQQPVLHERYRGAVEIYRASDGRLFLVGELAFQEYLKGIAEVPRRWPMEALKAQVVAARSYALSRLDPGGTYDLCATDACQVYLGAGVEMGPWGARWSRAVDETAGEALVWDGEPAQTFYFSTSNGRTYSNAEVWGTEPLPYLKGIVEEDDGHSPLSRWRVEVPFEDLARFLSHAGHWEGPVRRVTHDGEHVVVTGPKDRAVFHRDELRSALNGAAPCLAPSRYPSRKPDGYRLPQTVPSIWYDAREEDGSLIVEGRGWGHGIGMVQWGAYGKARRGMTYGEILEAYYGGLRPERIDTPDTIRVLVAQGLTSVTVAPSGEASVRGAGRRPDPPWRVTGEPRLRLRSGSPPAPQLRVSDFDAPRRGEAGKPLRASARLSNTASIRLDFMRDGDVQGSTDWRPVLEGVARVRLPVPEVPSGRYAVRLTATDGVDTVRSAPREVRVAGGGVLSASPEASPEGSEEGPAPGARAAPTSQDRPAAALAAVAVFLAAAVLVGLLLRTRRGRRLHRG